MKLIEEKDVPKLGKVPPSLRWGLIWGILRGEFLVVSMSAGEHGIQYQFIVQPKTVRRWLARNQALRAAQKEAKND